MYNLTNKPTKFVLRISKSNKYLILHITPCCLFIDLIQAYPVLTFRITLKRKPLFYLYNLLFPCIVLVVTDAMVFLLPPESGEKITLAVTVLLAMMVFLTVIMQNVPTTSLVIPLLGR